jgi:hypothetical protein
METRRAYTNYISRCAFNVSQVMKAVLKQLMSQSLNGLVGLWKDTEMTHEDTVSPMQLLVVLQKSNLPVRSTEFANKLQLHKLSIKRMT